MTSLLLFVSSPFDQSLQHAFIPLTLSPSHMSVLLFLPKGIYSTLYPVTRRSLNIILKGISPSIHDRQTNVEKEKRQITSPIKRGKRGNCRKWVNWDRRRQSTQLLNQSHLAVQLETRSARVFQAQPCLILPSYMSQTPSSALDSSEYMRFRIGRGDSVERVHVDAVGDGYRERWCGSGTTASRPLSTMAESSQLLCIPLLGVASSTHLISCQ